METCNKVMRVLREMPVGESGGRGDPEEGTGNFTRGSQKRLPRKGAWTERFHRQVLTRWIGKRPSYQGIRGSILPQSVLFRHWA